MNFKNAILVFCAVATLASCNKEEDTVVNQAGNRTVTLKLSAPQSTTRAVEGSIDSATPEVKKMTLYYYTTMEGASIGSRILNDAEIDMAKNAGLHISVPSTTQYVSMTGNEGSATSNILGYQGLNADGQATSFKQIIPLKSERTAITTSGTVSSVVLKPTAQLARIEVSGSINTEPTAPQLKAYEYAKVKGVYCNNYKLTSDATDFQLYKKENSGNNLLWDQFPETMKDLLDDTARASLAANGNDKKCAAYQVFPASEIQNLPHIILEVVYKEVNAQDEQTGYFTINRYRKPNATDFMTKMEGGFIYKLDISKLSSKFQNAKDPNTGDTIDPTDPTPELDKTELVVTVEPVDWTVENIVPGI